jgi:hypothetical protein
MNSGREKCNKTHNAGRQIRADAIGLVASLMLSSNAVAACGGTISPQQYGQFIADPNIEEGVKIDLMRRYYAWRVACIPAPAFCASAMTPQLYGALMTNADFGASVKAEWTREMSDQQRRCGR